MGVKYEAPPIEQMEKASYHEDHLDATPGGDKRLRRLDSDALDGALMSKRITMDQHFVLEEFRGRLYRAGMVFCPRSGSEVAGTSGQGMFLADSAFSRAKKIQSDMILLNRTLTKDEVSLVLGVLTMDAKVDDIATKALVKAATAFLT